MDTDFCRRGEASEGKVRMEQGGDPVVPAEDMRMAK